jgi:hypothetical protein
MDVQSRTVALIDIATHSNFEISNIAATNSDEFLNQES